MSSRKVLQTKCSWLCFFVLTLFGGTWLPAGEVDAQSTAFQVQRFRPWGDPDGMFQTQSGRTMGQLNYLVALTLNYAKDPLLLRRPDGTRFQDVLTHQVGADLNLGLGLFSWLDLIVTMPLTLYQIGTIPDLPVFGASERNKDLSGFAVSDPRIQLKIRALNEKDHGMSLAFRVGVGLPLGNKENFNGEDGVSLYSSLIWSKELTEGFHLGVNLGYNYLPPTSIVKLVIQHELTYSLGAAVYVAPDRFALIFDVGGATAFSDQTSLDTAPLDLYVGGRVLPLGNTDLAINFGVGLGLLTGYGSPQFRVLLGLVWSPRVRDRDRDGTLDKDDLCPDVPGPKENLGCPWPDTDQDGLNDNVDKCPKVAGPKENKGCPWPDTDKDGINDQEDKCPERAGPKENKGCPWPDVDGDGLKDNEDECPKIPGAKENKGCPWPDRDQDGILDKEDQCPDLPGVKEKKGCPPVILVKVTPKSIQILQKIFFEFNSANIKEKSYPILNQVSAVLKSQSQIKVQVEGHTDNRGQLAYNKKLSQRRAESVRKYLIGKGIAKERLIAKGFGMEKPIVSNKSRVNRAKNRRVEFNIVNK